MAVTTSEDASADKHLDEPELRKWKIFVSSTSAGLEGFRRVAREVIENFKYEGWQCFEPVMMEDFGARDGQAREVCADYVRGCDVLVGIIGIRYGAHPPDDQTSYTELEFQTATECQLSRLMFLLDEKVARGLEGVAPQGEDRADRQARLRERIGSDRVAELTLDTEDVFRGRLTSALETWVREDSFKRDIVDHSAEFKAARRRLLRSERTGEATLIYGEPGTGKTTLLTALRNDVLLDHAYANRLIVRIIRLAEGADAAKRTRGGVESALADLARETGNPVAELPPLIIALYLESDTETGADVDSETLDALGRLFSWDAPRAVVLAETNNRTVKEYLERDLGWTRDAVITVGDYDNVQDALEQMRRDAPSVRSWPEPSTRILAEALGLRPISLFTAAKDVDAEASRSPRRVPARIREQLAAIAAEETPEGKYGALVRGSIDHLSPEARDLLGLMTVLHPKPTVFPDEIAVALDLSLPLDDAVRIAATDDDAEDDSELSADDLAHRDKAYELVAELVGRGLLERLRRRGADPDTPPELTLHPAKVRVIRDYLPLDDDRRAQGQARAEAFYRKLVGDTVSGSFDSRFRMERGLWWEDAEEWIYHLGHITPDRAGISYAALFLDAYWWWDAYVEFDFCARLLDYSKRPRVQAVSPQMPEVAGLLAEFRGAYPREHEATVAQLHAEIAGEDPARSAGLQKTARAGAGIIPILKRLSDRVGITELDALFTGAASAESRPAAPSDKTRLHLLGLLCLFLAEGHRFRAVLEPGDAALAAAEACYRQAESYFRQEGDDWDGAWTRYLLGEVTSERGGDPDPLWDEAAAGAVRDSDTELLANVERARGDHLRATGDLEGALAHYGRAVFYGAALQVTSNLEAGADAYTKAFYREMRLHATKLLAEPLLGNQGSAADAGVAEAKRRLEVMLGEWGGAWKPGGDWKSAPGTLDDALGSASREAVEKTAGAITDAAFPPGPGDAVLGKPDSRYYQQVNNLIQQTQARPWVTGLDRWTDYRQEEAERRRKDAA